MSSYKYDITIHTSLNAIEFRGLSSAGAVKVATMDNAILESLHAITPKPVAELPVDTVGVPAESPSDIVESAAAKQDKYSIGSIGLVMRNGVTLRYHDIVGGTGMAGIAMCVKWDEDNSMSRVPRDLAHKYIAINIAMTVDGVAKRQVYDIYRDVISEAAHRIIADDTTERIYLPEEDNDSLTHFLSGKNAKYNSGYVWIADYRQFVKIPYLAKYCEMKCVAGDK